MSSFDFSAPFDPAEYVESHRATQGGGTAAPTLSIPEAAEPMLRGLIDRLVEDPAYQTATGARVKLTDRLAGLVDALTEGMTLKASDDDAKGQSQERASAVGVALRSRYCRTEIAGGNGRAVWISVFSPSDANPHYTIRVTNSVPKAAKKVTRTLKDAGLIDDSGRFVAQTS